MMDLGESPMAATWRLKQAIGCDKLHKGLCKQGSIRLMKPVKWWSRRPLPGPQVA